MRLIRGSIEIVKISDLSFYFTGKKRFDAECKKKFVLRHWPVLCESNITQKAA